LSLFSQSSVSTSVVFDAHAEPTTWTEAAITWINQPSLGAVVGTRGGLTSGAYNSWSISSVTGNGDYAFAVTTTNGTQRYLDSKENTANKPPQLALSWTDPVSQAPVASFTANPTSGVVPLTVQFTDTSTHGPTSWAWDFGDGGTSASQNPQHIYTTAGIYTVTLAVSNSYGSSQTSTVITVQAAGDGCTGFCLRVSGDRLVNGAGNVVQLRGVNRSGTQYACAEGWGIFDGPTNDDVSITAIGSWRTASGTQGLNVVRVNGNEDCALQINEVNPLYSGSNYVNALHDYSARLAAHGFYVILDLHHSAPAGLLATGQEPMADRDHSPAYWSVMAAAFKDQPWVMFDLYNEPHPDGNSDTPAAWTCVRDGGTCPGVSFTAAGSQEMLNAVRATGATNPVMIGGPQYAGTLTQWVAYAPTDPLAQLVASIHIYWQIPADPEWSPCYLQSCWDSVMAPLAATTPIVVGEVGEHDCDYGLEYGTALSPPQQNFYAWADAHGVGYLNWAWFTGNCADEPALISDYSGTPTQYGLGLKNYIAGLP
jgi:PKD repeat protein